MPEEEVAPLRRKELLQRLGIGANTLFVHARKYPKLFAPVRKGKGRRSSLYAPYQAKVIYLFLNGQLKEQEAEQLWELRKAQEISEVYAGAGDKTRQRRAANV